MKKIWAVICVVGFTAFWTYGLALAAAVFGDRAFNPFEIVFCLLGAAVGLYARYRILQFTPAMHGRRAKARARLEQEYLESSPQN